MNTDFSYEYKAADLLEKCEAMNDNVIPNGKWQFNQEVSEVFDNMLERSIPDYETMRNLVFNIGKHFVLPDTAILDIGCSNGIAAAPFAEKFGNRMLLLDVSECMLDICRERFKGNDRIEVKNHDLRQGLPEVKSSLILSILTIQFTPIEYRKKIIKSIFDSLVHGGCFIMVEKVLGNTADLDSVFVDEYYEIKRDHHYTNEQIESKRKSLEGVLVPITSDWNFDILRDAGFRQVDCFWRYLNFCGYIAIKA